MRRCEQTSEKYRKAAEILQSKNPNYPDKENSPEGLNGVAKRYVAFNGAVGQLQLDWFRNTLQEAREKQEKVIVLSHQDILSGSSNPVCLMWNYNDVLCVLREFRMANTCMRNA